MIKFTSELEINVPHIDEQHKELIRRINDFVSLGEKSVSREETAKTMDLLGAYVVEHFADEEKIQLECNYPKYEWHKEQHSQFVESFKRLKAEYEEKGPSLAFTLQLNKSVIDWVSGHIRKADMELGEFINLKNQG